MHNNKYKEGYFKCTIEIVFKSFFNKLLSLVNIYASKKKGSEANETRL